MQLQNSLPCHSQPAVLYHALPCPDPSSTPSVTSLPLWSCPLVCVCEDEEEEEEERDLYDFPVYTAAEKELLVVGCGALGIWAAKKWKTYRGLDAPVYGETRTNATHDYLDDEGILPQVKGADLGMGKMYDNVLFCAPPTGNDHYLQDFRDAAKRWTGKGQLVFTSSAGVYAEDDGGTVTEDSPVIEGNARVDKLLEVEKECLASGGSVVRLAGLMAADRGPHSFWLSAGEVKGRPEGLINMLSYEDAAGACVALLQKPEIRKEVFLVSDGAPVTREEICRSALKLRKHKDTPMPEFVEGDSAGLGKKYDISKIREVVGWQPNYKSFDDFINHVAEAELAFRTVLHLQTKPYLSNHPDHKAII